MFADFPESVLVLFPGVLALANVGAIVPSKRKIASEPVIVRGVLNMDHASELNFETRFPEPHLTEMRSLIGCSKLRAGLSKKIVTPDSPL